MSCLCKIKSLFQPCNSEKLPENKEFIKIATSKKCYSIYIEKISKSLYLGDIELDANLNKSSTLDFVVSFLHVMKLHDFKVTHYNFNEIISIVTPSINQFWFTDGSYLEYLEFCGYFTYNKVGYRKLLCPLCFTKFEESINLAELISEELLSCNLKIDKKDLEDYLKRFLISDNLGSIVFRSNSYEFHSDSFNVSCAFNRFSITVFNKSHYELKKYQNLSKDEVLEIVYKDLIKDINRNCFLVYMSLCFNE